MGSVMIIVGAAKFAPVANAKSTMIVVGGGDVVSVASAVSGDRVVIRVGCVTRTLP